MLLQYVLYKYQEVNFWFEIWFSSFGIGISDLREVLKIIWELHKIITVLMEIITIFGTLRLQEENSVIKFYFEELWRLR